MATLQELLAQKAALERQIDEARREDRAAAIAQVKALMEQHGLTAADLIGKAARIGPGGLRQHHRGVGREIAMRRIARRLDRNSAEIEPARKSPLCGDIIERGENHTAEVAENVSHFEGGRVDLICR